MVVLVHASSIYSPFSSFSPSSHSSHVRITPLSSIKSLPITVTILPKRDESAGITIDFEVTPPPAVTPEGDLYPPVLPIGGEHVIYNGDPNEEKKEDDTPLKVGDIKLPTPRKAHPV